jgi:3-deoxy-D-manno-octulosonic-acid transferase
LEPALFKKPVIVGSDMSNFTEVMQQLLRANGVIQLTSQTGSSDLAEVVTDLLNNSEKRTLLGDSAYEVVMQNQGASDRTLAHLHRLVQ